VFPVGYELNLIYYLKKLVFKGLKFSPTVFFISPQLSTVSLKSKRYLSYVYNVRNNSSYVLYFVWWSESLCIEITVTCDRRGFCCAKVYDKHSFNLTVELGRRLLTLVMIHLFCLHISVFNETQDLYYANKRNITYSTSLR
jgi:hypothetical protein